MGKDIHEQIRILKEDKKMIISDDSNTRKRLLSCNYYNIVNGFKDLFLQNKIPEEFIIGTTFEELISVYEFDRKLRILFLEYILKVENNIKTKIAYEFSILYGDDTYNNIFIYKNTNFKETKDVLELQSKLFSSLSRTNSHDITEHFINQKSKNIPIWSLVNMMDFGTTRTFYNCLKDTLKYKIANHYWNLSIGDFYTLVSSLNMFRNVCAHDNRLIFYKIKNTELKVADLDVHKNMNIIKNASGNYIRGKNDCFSVVVSLKYLLSEEDFNTFFSKLEELINEINIYTISKEKVLDVMGFPKSTGLSSTDQLDWKAIKIMSKFNDIV